MPSDDAAKILDLLQQRFALLKKAAEVEELIAGEFAPRSEPGAGQSAAKPPPTKKAT